MLGPSLWDSRSLLAHELAHVRRHDYLVNLLQCGTEVLLFYHPVVWWLSGHIRREREQVCDDLAVNVTCDRVVYSRALLSVAELATRPSPLALAADGGGELKERVKKVLGMPVAPVRISIVVAMTSILLIFGVAAYWIVTSCDANQGSAAISATAGNEDSGQPHEAVEQAVRDLGNSSFRERQDAATALVKAGQREEFVGVWRVTEMNGVLCPADRFSRYSIDGTVDNGVRFEVVASHEPKWLTFWSTDNAPSKCIYSRVGDKITVCEARRGDFRPSQFVKPPGGSLYTLQRVTPVNEESHRLAARRSWGSLRERVADARFQVFARKFAASFKKRQASGQMRHLRFPMEVEEGAIIDSWNRRLNRKRTSTNNTLDDNTIVRNQIHS